MRRSAIMLLVAVLGFAPSFASAWSLTAEAPQSAKTVGHESPNYVYPLVLAAGALAGVVTVNWLTYGVGTIPLTIGMESTAPVVSPAAAAASRIYVITSGVLGAWVADLLYNE